MTGKEKLWVTRLRKTSRLFGFPRYYQQSISLRTGFAPNRKQLRISSKRVGAQKTGSHRDPVYEKRIVKLYSPC